MTAKSAVMVADFETTTDLDDCRVWGYSICEIPSLVVSWGTTIEDFLRVMAKQSAKVYFHNLAFDGSFILDWLLNHGYKYTDEQTPRRFQFTSLISRDGKFYSITVRWGNGKVTEFRDSYKKLPMAVRDIARSFKLEESKGHIQYDAPRPKGYQPTPDEIEYMTNDVVIVAKALMQQFDEGMTRLTVGSDSLHMYKKLNPDFGRLFPILPYDMDCDVRLAYRGGFTYADKRHRGEIVGHGKVYDVNSLYPSVMYDSMLPYGFPVWVDTIPEVTEDFPLFIASITFTAKLKPDHIPCIQLKASSFFLPTEYVDEISEPTTMSLTNIDLALWDDQYDIDILSWNGAWRFHGAKGFFAEYIDYWMGIKQNSSGGLREIAKLHLNSLYGKFATNPDVTQKVPSLENGVLALHMGPSESRDPVYTPMGVFITSYAREKTVRAAQEHYGVFMYADTDSLHLLTNDTITTEHLCDPVKFPDCGGHHAELDVDPVRLGAWKHEKNFDSAIFVRAKCYTEHSSTCNCSEIEHDEQCVHCQELPHKRGCGFETHIAGLPAMVAQHVEFSDYYEGHEFNGKLLPKRVPGGIVLLDVKFTLHTT